MEGRRPRPLDDRRGTPIEIKECRASHSAGPQDRSSNERGSSPYPFRRGPALPVAAFPRASDWQESNSLKPVPKTGGQPLPHSQITRVPLPSGPPRAAEPSPLGVVGLSGRTMALTDAGGATELALRRPLHADGPHGRLTVVVLPVETRRGQIYVFCNRFIHADPVGIEPTTKRLTISHSAN